MRIGLLGTRGVPARYGGFETAAEEIGARLVEHGHEVVVYCRNPGQDLVHYQGMELVNLPALRARAAETLSPHRPVRRACGVARPPRRGLRLQCRQRALPAGAARCRGPGGDPRGRAGVAARQVGHSGLGLLPMGGGAQRPVGGRGDRRRVRDRRAHAQGARGPGALPALRGTDRRSRRRSPGRPGAASRASTTSWSPGSSRRTTCARSSPGSPRQLPGCRWWWWATPPYADAYRDEVWTTAGGDPRVELRGEHLGPGSARRPLRARRQLSARAQRRRERTPRSCAQWAPVPR